MDRTIAQFDTSSAIDKISYSDTERQLVVSFRKTRNTYVYSNIPGNLIDQLFLSSSAGEFFNKNIRPIFSGVKNS